MRLKNWLSACPRVWMPPRCSLVHSKGLLEERHAQFTKCIVIIVGYEIFWGGTINEERNEKKAKGGEYAIMTCRIEIIMEINLSFRWVKEERQCDAPYVIIELWKSLLRF